MSVSISSSTGSKPMSSSTAAPRRGSGSRSVRSTTPLYDAFGQRQVSTIYAARNQYHVVMEVAPEYWQTPETLSQIYVSTGGGPVRATPAPPPAGGAGFRG